MAKIRNKSKNAGKYLVSRKKSIEEIEKEKEISNEDKMYWGKIIVGAVSAVVGRWAFGLIGWWMLLWMIIFWLPFSFILSFMFKIPYDKEKWDWKTILKTGIGGFFFSFMLISTITHTLLVYQNYIFIQ